MSANPYELASGDLSWRVVLAAVLFLDEHEKRNGCGSFAWGFSQHDLHDDYQTFHVRIRHTDVCYEWENADGPEDLTMVFRQCVDDLCLRFLPLESTTTRNMLSPTLRAASAWLARRNVRRTFVLQFDEALRDALSVRLDEALRAEGWIP